jgi:hypothetical protein
MKYEELRSLCVTLYGLTWKPNLANDLNIKRSTIDNWSSQGCPKWLDNEVALIIKKRKDEINALN